MDDVDEFSETLDVPVQPSDAEDVKTVFGEGSCLVEAADIDLATDVDSARRNTEDT